MMDADLLHDEITAVHKVWRLLVRSLLNPTPRNVAAYRRRALACKCPPMRAVFPESLLERERLD